MAGSISLSGSQQFDNEGVPLAGGLLYFFQSGTTTPQSAFQDTALTIPYSNPIVLGADGRVPFFYLADGNIKIRLTDDSGVTIVAADSILVIGPSAGGGGGGSVDPTTVYQTGDIKHRYGTGTHTGWVRANGRTIGSAPSGATERANADTQALFEYLWTADPILVVSTGRGASANADWVANKTIALPDFRGRVLAGNDDMGNVAANRITPGGSLITGTALGAAGGSEQIGLGATHIPAHTHSFSATTASDGAHTHTGTTASAGDHTHTIPSSVAVASGAGEGVTNDTGSAQSTGTAGAHTHTFTSDSGGAHTHTVSGTSGSTGDGTPFQVVQPTMVAHIYIKL
jgi:microcystin-dependent protein